MSKFLSLTFNFEGKDPPLPAIEESLNKARDWLKYAPNCWLLYTSNTEKIWADRMRLIVGEKASIFVVEINIRSKFGYMPKFVWEWIEKNIKKQEVNPPLS